MAGGLEKVQYLVFHSLCMTHLEFHSSNLRDIPSIMVT